MRVNTEFIDSLVSGENSERYRGKYLQVRYEELALSPIETVKKIYKFIERPATERVLRWIRTATRAGNSGNFGTRRDSSKTVESWRSYLSFVETTEVQKHCGDVMMRHGYEEVTSRKDLRNANVKWLADDDTW